MGEGDLEIFGKKIKILRRGGEEYKVVRNFIHSCLEGCEHSGDVGHVDVAGVELDLLRPQEQVVYNRGVFVINLQQ